MSTNVNNLEKWEYVIAPEGTTATVSLQYKDEGDYGWCGYSWDVIVKFSDPALNPLDEEYWTTGGNFYPLRADYFDMITKYAIEQGEKFYAWFMNLRTGYSLESTVNAWRVRYEDERDARREALRETQTLRDKLSGAESRIKELETDYI